MNTVKTAVRSYITEDKKKKKGREGVTWRCIHILVTEHKNNLVKRQVIHIGPKSESMCQFKRRENRVLAV